MNDPSPQDSHEPGTAQPESPGIPPPEKMDAGSPMWKFWSLVGLFAAFIAFVIFFVYPNQEGMISSTQLQIGALKKTSRPPMPRPCRSRSWASVTRGGRCSSRS